MKRHSLRKMILAFVLIAAVVLPGLPALADSVATVSVEAAPVYTTPYSATAAVMGTVHKGVKVTVRAISGNIAKVIVGGKTGYMSLTTLSTGSSASAGSSSAGSSSAGGTGSASQGTPVSSGDATVTADRLTVYRYASTGSASLGTLRRGVAVTVLAVKGTWAAVRVAGKTGYCLVSGLSVGKGSTGSASAAPAPTATAAPTGTVTVKAGDRATTTRQLVFYTRASTSASTYGTFKAGVEVEVRGVSGQWAKIVYGNKGGFVLAAGLARSSGTVSAAPTASSSSTGYTHRAIGTASLYQKPSTSSRVVKKLSAGQQVVVRGESGGWLKITAGGTTYYGLEKEFIEISKTQSALVIASTITVYASPSLSAPAIGTIAEGASIDLYAISGGWGKMLYNGSKGYVLVSKVVTGASAYTTLKTGSSGSAVRTLQDRLETLGYFDGVPAGNYGAITAAAVKRFQTKMGLNVTGTANAATQAALFSSRAQASGILTSSLANGAKGDMVTRLQTRLLYKSWYAGNVDGTFGNSTIKAVKAFQKKVGLAQTGAADAATLKALFAPDAPTGTVGSGSSSTSKTLNPPDLDSGNEDIETVIRYALAQIGKPYVYGTSGPNSFDCSGLTYFCYKKVGIALPRSAYDVGYSGRLGERISYEELRRGDVVCFNTMGDSDLSDHVGIYLGNGLFIHAPHTGSYVQIVSMTSGYYLRNFSWARRPIP